MDVLQRCAGEVPTPSTLPIIELAATCYTITKWFVIPCLTPATTMVSGLRIKSAEPGGSQYAPLQFADLEAMVHGHAGPPHSLEVACSTCYMMYVPWGTK